MEELKVLGTTSKLLPKKDDYWECVNKVITDCITENTKKP